MATELKTDAMPLPPVPVQFLQDRTLVRYLQQQHDYLQALQADLKKLRDAVDSYHP